MPGSAHCFDLPGRWALGIMVVGALVFVNAATGHAQDDRRWPRPESWGLNVAYGSTYRHSIQFYSLLPRVALSLPKVIEEPLAQYKVRGQWVVEPFVSYVTDASDRDTVEAGVNLVLISLRYDWGQPLVPYIEGGAGALYTGLQERGLGKHFLFSLPVGVGMEWFFTRTTALTVTYRFRHLSNAGMSSHNTGLNTDFYMLGLSYSPHR